MTDFATSNADVIMTMRRGVLLALADVIANEMNVCRGDRQVDDAYLWNLCYLRDLIEGFQGEMHPSVERSDEGQVDAQYLAALGRMCEEIDWYLVELTLPASPFEKSQDSTVS
jgi:hypothetical protein